MSERFIQKPSELPQLLDLLSGKELEGRINEMAEIGAGGRIGEGGSRLTLSSEDMQARDLLENWMRRAGMTIEKHPLGLIGTNKGTNPALPAVGFGSHFDTVPRGGRYDGTIGVIGAIAIVEAFNELGIKPARSLKVFALTGEESSRFGVATFGSKGMCQGLTDEILARTDKDAVSIKQALVDCGFNHREVRNPIVKEDTLANFIELHVQQEAVMADREVQIGAVESIAAPVRFYAVFGEPQSEDRCFCPGMHTFLLRLTILGKAGHSGALPMGARVDGLVGATHFMSFLVEEDYPGTLYREGLITEDELNDLQGLSSRNRIMLGAVDVKSGAINKVPGETEMMIAVEGEEANSVGVHLQAALLVFLTKLDKARPESSAIPFKMEIIKRAAIDPGDYVFYPLEDVVETQTIAAEFIRKIEQAAVEVGDKTVGTAGYMAFQDNGQIIIPVDIRGIHSQSRGEVVEQVVDFVEKNGGKIEKRREEEPVAMDSEVVDRIKNEAEKLGLIVEGLDSHAGHDAMSFAFAGIPTAMIFIPSRNGGVSHVPEEYSTLEDLENGVKVLAATVYRLAEKMI